jgi:dTMP kinase
MGEVNMNITKNKAKTHKISNGVNDLRGKFISFEGPEGSGKTTHIELLAEYLKGRNYSVEVLQEPGSTKVGKKIREILLDPDIKNMTAECELHLYLAARIQLVKEKIKKFLSQGKIILCDRFNDATLTYQGFAAGIPVDFIIDLTENHLFKDAMPDLTILLDVDPRKGLKRAETDHPKDRQEKKDISFHKKVREGYLKLAKMHPDRIKVVSSNGSIEQVQNNIRKIIENAIV